MPLPKLDLADVVYWGQVAETKTWDTGLISVEQFTEPLFLFTMLCSLPRKGFTFMYHTGLSTHAATYLSSHDQCIIARKWNLIFITHPHSLEQKIILHSTLLTARRLEMIEDRKSNFNSDFWQQRIKAKHDELR
jgi:hypothetical protein